MFVSPRLLGALGYVVVYQALSLVEYRRLARHYEEYSRELHADLQYLCHKMNENGIELTEFDKIVLNHVHSREEQEKGC